MFKPCPFCGGANIEIMDDCCPGPIFLNCNDCICDGPTGETVPMAIEAWNNRDPNLQVRQVVKIPKEEL